VKPAPEEFMIPTAKGMAAPKSGLQVTAKKMVKGLGAVLTGIGETLEGKKEDEKKRRAKKK
jgi:hypothetical protein